MELVQISVPYTGTNFTAKLFTDIGFERIGMLDSPSQDDTLHVAHSLKDTQVAPALELAKTCPVIIPIRHPFRCELSTIRMGADVDQMILGYENILRFNNPFYMPVDSGRREAYFDLLRFGLDLPLETDWEVVSSKAGTHSIPFQWLKPSQEVVDLVDRHKDFFDQFYA